MRRNPADVDFTADGAVDAGREGVKWPAGEAEQLPNDEWILNTDVLIRKGNPRRAMLTPSECGEPPPIPMGTIDLTRSTTTSLETIDDGHIVDVWDRAMHDRRLVVIRLVRRRALRYHQGILTRLRITSRPANVWPETWDVMSQNQCVKAIAEWKELMARMLSLVTRTFKRDEARRTPAAQKAVDEEWLKLRDMRC